MVIFEGAEHAATNHEALETAPYHGDAFQLGEAQKKKAWTKSRWECVLKHNRNKVTILVFGQYWP